MAAAEVRFVPADWPRMPEVAALRYAVLYEPFGVAPDGGWDTDEPGSRHAVALADDGEVLGYARLLPAPGDAERQVRQVTVAPDARGAGVGRALMGAVERRAAEEGAASVWLAARKEAVAFYERLGYAQVGGWFVSEMTGIPHVRMRKRFG
jgi:predicted GNAT family N-acyltransferase